MHLVAVEAPVLELLLEQRAAHVGGVVQLARAVVVQDLPEHARVPAVTCQIYLSRYTSSNIGNMVE